MIHSMTGFGKGIAQSDRFKVVIEIRSVNSKQADINLRVPSELRFLDMDFRKQLNDELGRGKIDLFLHLEQIHPEQGLQLDASAAAAYWERLQELVKATGIPMSDDPLRTILKLPGVMLTEETESNPEEELAPVAKEALSEAIRQLKDFRAQEGEALYAGFVSNLKNITGYLNAVEPYEEERLVDVRQRLEEGLQKYVSVDYERSRLEQEMIFYIEKLDINEEKNRLRNHLHYFQETLDLPELGQGRKLGFISQEMGREINTLGAKSNHADMQKLVVKMKDELEQIKEQVLNVL